VASITQKNKNASKPNFVFGSLHNRLIFDFSFSPCLWVGKFCILIVYEERTV
jgi:hypothetical protein